MTRHTIVVKRNAFGNMSGNTIGTDAFNAVSRIPYVTEVRIEAEDDTQVKISYVYTSTEKNWLTYDHLAKFYLECVD